MNFPISVACMHCYVVACIASYITSHQGLNKCTYLQLCNV